MTSPSTEKAEVRNHPTTDGSLPEFVDWLVAAGIVLGGLISLVGGSALFFIVDRDLLAEGIEGGTVTVTLVQTELTDAEMLEVVLAVVSWTGIGLLVTGLGMVVFAIAYVIRRRRTHRRVQNGEAANSYWAYVVLGAVVTAVLSFIPFSPGIGGAIAGYLERGESDRTVSVGALSGLFSMLPLLAIVVASLGGLVAGLLAIDQAGVAIVVVVGLIFVLMLVATIGAGLGALGGYIGGRFAER